jgi:AraC family transcriptional regulator
MDTHLQAVLTALEYLENHLLAPLTIQELATVSGFSLFHFIRVFNQCVGLTPYNYLMRRRLTEAAKKLLCTDIKIVDLAMDCQFGSHEGFTRAFQRMFKQTPTQWRERGVRNSWMMLDPVGANYLLTRAQPEFGVPQIIALDPVDLVGWMVPVENAESDVEAQWKRMVTLVETLSTFRQADGWYRIRILPLENAVPASCFWGIQRAGKVQSQLGLAHFHLKEGSYLKMTAEKKQPDIAAQWTYLIHGFLPKSGFNPTQPMIVEHYCKQLNLLLPVAETG